MQFHGGLCECCHETFGWKIRNFFIISVTTTLWTTTIFHMASLLSDQFIIIAPIFLGRCPSLSAHESESMLRTYLFCWENIRRLAAGKQLVHGNSTQYLLITAILLAQRLTSYWGNTVSLRMLINLRLAKLVCFTLLKMFIHCIASTMQLLFVSSLYKIYVS
jgi:hypothetical protein